jgi:threonylcarbamoyladenosine tRNA methylthiotransferase CDKAL1
LRIYIETYGCALSRADEFIMKTVLSSRGHIITSNIEDADAIIINTCTVRYDTELKMRDRIRKLYLYATRNGKKLIVAGCMAAAQPYQVAKIAPNASLVSPQNASKIWKAVESDERVILLGGVKDRTIIGRWVENRVAYLPIQEGCLGNCSFCITRLARRKLTSYPIKVIRSALSDIVGRGAVEVEFSGQDTASYGIDLYGKPMLPSLIREVASVRGNYMIRIGMMNPDTLHPILDELVDAIRANEHVYWFLHIPVQSGSDKVLRIMRRKYTVDEYKSIVREVRRKLPGISIATDIIVGHPGETEEDFRETLRLIRELDFERVHMAAYTIRPNTYAASLPQIPSKIKKERLKRLLQVVEEVGLRVHEVYVGKTLEVLVTEHNKGWVGRTRNYIPVILHDDGVNYGMRLRTRIIGASFYDLRGEAIG